MVSNGILPTRDAASHALQLGAFLNPDMPGSFNELIRDVSKRAGHMSGTLAQREALPMSERFRGLCWVTVPDDPSIGEWTPRPVYWTGTYWDDPLQRQRARFVPRSSYFAGDKSGINGNLRTSVMQATWPNAPAGQYRIDFSFSMDGPEQPKTSAEGVTQTKTASNDMIIALEANNVSLRADWVDDVGPITRNYTPFGLVDDHAGGDLRVEAFVFINGTTGTLYTAGTAVMFQHLGPYLHG